MIKTGWNLGPTELSIVILGLFLVVTIFARLICEARHVGIIITAIGSLKDVIRITRLCTRSRSRFRDVLNRCPMSHRGVVS
jgi:hypothetical protein